MSPEEARQVLSDRAKAAQRAVWLEGGRRCAVKQSEWMEGWWVGTSPRNGDNATVEGPWEDWVTLARNILAYDAMVQTGMASVSIPEIGE